jgi:hypothetical protein
VRAALASAGIQEGGETDFNHAFIGATEFTGNSRLDLKEHNASFALIFGF